MFSSGKILQVSGQIAHDFPGQALHWCATFPQWLDISPGLDTSIGVSRLEGLTACERTYEPFEMMGYLGVFS